MKKRLLKNSFLSLIVISILLLFQNCSKEDFNENDLILENQTLLKDSPVVDKLIEMGYNRETIIELDNFYLVGGDIMFSKNLSDYSDKNEKGIYEKHASSNNLVSYSNRIITVYVHSSIPTSGADNWRNAINSAINDWNEISDCFITFQLSTNSNSDIIIRSDQNQLSNNVIASAGFPNNNQPYNTILINLDFLSNLTVSESIKKRNIAHELGHCIGFRHTNWDIRGESALPTGANLIPGTPDQDPNSVMNGGTALDSWIGFSTYDVIATEYLYPIPVIPFSVDISGPIFGDNSGYYTWSAIISNGTAPYTYSWKRSSNQGVTYPYFWGDGTTSYTAQMPLDQDLWLELTVTDSLGLTAVNYFVTENTGGGVKDF